MSVCNFQILTYDAISEDVEFEEGVGYSDTDLDGWRIGVNEHFEKIYLENDGTRYSSPGQEIWLSCNGERALVRNGDNWMRYRLNEEDGFQVEGERVDEATDLFEDVMKDDEQGWLGFRE